MMVLRTFSGPYFVEYPKDKAAVPDRSPKYLTDSMPNKIEFPKGVMKRSIKRSKSRIDYSIFKSGQLYGAIRLSEHGRYPDRVTLKYIDPIFFSFIPTEEDIENILKAVIETLRNTKRFKILTVYDDGKRWTWACQNLKFYQDSFWSVDGKGELGMSIKL